MEKKLKVLHITDDGSGYEVVYLIANRVNRTNHFSVIETIEGERLLSGGMIITDTLFIREILDKIPKEDQYEFVKEFKIDPFVRPYLEEPFGKDEWDEINKKMAIEDKRRLNELRENNRHSTNRKLVVIISWVLCLIGYGIMVAFKVKASVAITTLVVTLGVTYFVSRFVYNLYAIKH